MRLKGIKKPMTVQLPATSQPDSPDILVIGSANADLVVLVDRRPAAGETVIGGISPSARAGRGQPGGGGGPPGSGVCRLSGPDAYGQLLLASLTRAGVDVSETCHLDGVPPAWP
jgi:ribokinase